MRKMTLLSMFFLILAIQSSKIDINFEDGFQPTL
jgi:hypothetical protein